VTTSLRLSVGGTTLFAGLWFLATVSAAPPLAKDTAKKVAEADIAQLRKHLDTINEKASEAKRYAPTAKTLAIMVAAEAEAVGDEALKTGALKTAEAIAKKDYKAAAAAAKDLVYKPGAGPLKDGAVYKMHKFNLEEAMGPFRGKGVGGLNIEKDIRDIKNGKVAVDPEAIEILAGRTAQLGEFTAAMPNEKATTNDANKKDWDRWSKDMTTLGVQLSAEAAKGKNASEKDIKKMLNNLDARCSDCHNKFRD
jgi:hypothetical protein